jgi:hypothetical protein
MEKVADLLGPPQEGSGAWVSLLGRRQAGDHPEPLKFANRDRSVCSLLSQALVPPLRYALTMNKRILRTIIHTFSETQKQRHRAP